METVIILTYQYSMSGDGESLILFDIANFYFGIRSWQISYSPHILSVKPDTFPEQGWEKHWYVEVKNMAMIISFNEYRPSKGTRLNRAEGGGAMLRLITGMRMTKYWLSHVWTAPTAINRIMQQMMLKSETQHILSRITNYVVENKLLTIDTVKKFIGILYR